MEAGTCSAVTPFILFGSLLLSIGVPPGCFVSFILAVILLFSVVQLHSPSMGLSLLIVANHALNITLTEHSLKAPQS